jgi:transposase|tara:strand:- start:425 stop:622 length:198 start_codon:yes stop_codon:yes gene_type:complete
MPDITLKALVAELAEQGITTSTASVWRLVRSEGLRFKKRCSTSSSCGRRSRAGASSGRDIRGGLI